MQNLKTFLLSFLISTTLLNAEISYEARDIGTLATDKSEARALNQNGWIVGKYFNKKQCSDFLWGPDCGLIVITNEADKEIFPKLNNHEQVIGYILKDKKSWLSSVQMQMYKFNPQDGLKPAKLFDRKDGMYIAGFNDKNSLLFADHVDLYKSNFSFVTHNNKLIQFAKRVLDEKVFASAINNKSQVLVTFEAPGIFGSEVLGIYCLSIYDLETQQFTNIDDSNLYYGVGLNDNSLIIARNKKGTEGFYGSQTMGMISLGDFVPTALNNLGVIIGKNKKAVLLRTPEGLFIDLNEAIDRKAIGIDEIIQAWSINDQGQILVTAKISGKEHVFLLNPLKN